MSTNRFLFDRSQGQAMLTGCLRASLACATTLACSLSAHADQLPPAPSSAASQAPATSTGEASGAVDKPRFDVWEYRVLGNTTLPMTTIEGVLYPMLGSGKTIDDVELTRQALEKAYHDAGYGTVFVDIPEQQTTGGVVRLKVTEGRIARVNISGARYFSAGQILASVPALSSGEVPNLPEVQGQLVALNDATADRRVTPVLKAGSAPGTVDVDLKVADELPLHGSLEVNNRYSADTAKLRLTGALSYDNLFQKQHSLSLLYQTAPENPDNLTAYVASYAFRVPSWDDTTLTAYYVDSNTDVATFGTLGVIGDGQIAGLRATRPLPSSEGLFHNFSIAAEYKDFLENIQLTEDESLETPIDYVNWTLMYAGLYRGEHGNTAFNLGANFGLRGIANETLEFAEKRYFGEASYFYLRGGLQHWRDLPYKLQLFVRFAAQLSAQALVSNEQFAIGGMESVRGYTESALLGDSGVSATIELRSLWPATLLGLEPGSIFVLAFADAGYVSTIDPLPDQTASAEIESIGLGLRGSWSGLDAVLDWAHALTTEGTTNAGDNRALFSVRYGF
jgi:hemolysin activation/secretion protein